MKILLILPLIFIFSANLFAQNKKDTVAEKENIKVVTRFKNGAVELRWYPTNAASWRKANQLGYTIKRKELSEVNTGNELTQLATIKPYTTEEWRQKTNINDRLVKGTMEAIAIKTTAKDVTAANEEENENFIVCMLTTSLSADAAKGAALTYTDAKIESGKEYVYSISINNGKGKKNNNDEVLAFVTNTRSSYNAPSPKGVSLEEGEGVVKLSWNNTSNKDLFAAYNIERSSDGGRTFIKVNDFPFTSVAENPEVLFYTDSIKNYIPYQYRIVGITPWADNSNPSDVVAGMGRDKTPASPPMNTRAKGDRSKIVVTWELPVQSKDLKGFKVARSQNLEGPFNSINDRIISTSERMFIDAKPSPHEPFYAVYSVDTANNLSSTFSVMASVYDSVAPSQPKGLTGQIDTNGVVKLNWKFGKDNDLLGYQVYMSNGKNNVYKQLTSSPLVDSVLIDTVNMRSLNENVYYKITAVDYNNNASAYSEILTVKRPDVIPPSAPVITAYNVVNGKVTMDWVNSTSKDVIKQALVRRSATAARDEKVLLEFRDNTTHAFIDSTASEGTSYSYEVRAYDKAGHITASTPLEITIAETSSKPGVERFTAQWNSSEKKARLQWNFSNKDEYELVLFKAGEDGELKAYKKLSAGKTSFEETLSNGKYQYAIKVIYASGADQI